MDVESLENARPPVLRPPARRAHRPPQLLASLRQHSADPVTLPPPIPAFHRGDVIEIQGPASSGKTHLLYHVLLSVLVPATRAEFAAVIYDTDAAFDVQRFRRLLLSRISRLPSTPLDPHESVRRVLTRLHVFRPTSLAQLAASIVNLRAYHASHMPNQEIAVLAIDSVNTFYWADRFAAEQLRNTASAKDKGVPMALSLHHVFGAIQSVQRSHRPLVVLTNWALSSTPSHSELLYKQHLHPFPVIEDGIPDLGAKVMNDTDHSSSSPFRLAHHIALSSPLSDPSHAVLPDDTLLRDTRHGKGNIDNGRMRCLARSSGGSGAVSFAFQITDDDTVVYPQQLAELTPSHDMPF